LQRNSNIRIFGGISLGINITVEQAFELGFDHLAMCVGAGKPKIVQMKNALTKGVRTASDFLMTLQSGGAFLEKSITNLLIRMPVAIIGGGLTSIDAATESLNYYKIQVEKFYKQYQLSIQQNGKDLTEKNWAEEDKQIAEEFIEHAKLFSQAKDKESIHRILNHLGGATIYYRGKLQNSPAYKLNPEEVIYAMAAGVNFAENMTPIGINVNEYGYAESIEFDNLGERKTIRAKTVITSIGTESNWHQQEMELAITSAIPAENCSDGCHSREGGNPDQNSHREKTLVQTTSSRATGKRRGDLFFAREIAASATASSLIDTRQGHWIPAYAGMTEASARMTQPSAELAITYFGDCNPKFAGSVVKALASSKEGYKIISKRLAENSPNFSGIYQEFLTKLDYLLLSHIHEINILSDKIVELIVHSPLAAANFQAGQFFRLQNYSKDISSVIEPLALTGAYVDKEKGLIHLIILESGESSKLCRYLKVGEQIVLMGPSGTPSETLRDSNVVLIGGGLGNASLLPIARALKDNNCNVTYFAAYRNLQDRFYQERIEASSDVVVWCCEEGVLTKNRSNDFSLQGNIVDGIRLFSQTLDPIDLIICIGSTSMMEAVKNIKTQYFSKDTRMIISVNSPMQCMMKGICGQCVQIVTDQRGYIFSCACQDQEAETIDFDCLKNRLEQNSLLEKLSNVIR
jgi:NAD(P)H-flavin reductase/NADPH-dependent glutamate synthase beta subunit-like oxidoreductase